MTINQQKVKFKNMLDYQNFYYAIQNLKRFIKEQDKLDAVLKVLSPTTTGVCEFGNVFIDDYINLLELAVNDNSNWVSWFVFDNDFGANKLKVKNKFGLSVKIANEKQLYDFCIKDRP